jgi:thymidylate kinase
VTIVNVRGPNGSGKSTIVREFLDAHPHQQIFGVCGTKRPEAYKVPFLTRPVYVLGSYLVGVGGCDRIGSAEQIQELVLKYRLKGHVLFEGLIISDYYGKLCEALEPFGKDVVVIFLTTPYEVCLKRLHARQADAVSKAKGEKNVRHHYDANQAVKKRMKADGIFQVLELESERVFDVLLGLLKCTSLLNL